jgi:hypothetical protein
VSLLALAIGQPPHSQQIWTLEQAHAVPEAEAHAPIELRGDIAETELPDSALQLHPSNFSLPTSAFNFTACYTRGHN